MRLLHFSIFRRPDPEALLEKRVTAIMRALDRYVDSQRIFAQAYYLLPCMDGDSPPDLKQAMAAERYASDRLREALTEALR